MRPRILGGGLVALLALALAVGLAELRGTAPAPAAPVGRSPFLRPAAAPTFRLSLPDGSEAAAPGAARFSSLVDLPWRHASTGWQVLADTDTPLRDHSFTWGPMVIAGETFSRGISTYPFSEIVYPLEGRALRLSARIGVTDDSKAGAGSVRFSIYGEGFLLYESGVVRTGERARRVDLSIEGLGELRLVVDDAGDGSLGDYALWAEPSVVLSPDPPGVEALAAIDDVRQEQAVALAQASAAEGALLKALVHADGGALARHAGQGTETRGEFDSTSSLLILGNRRIGVGFGYGGSLNGRLTVTRSGDEFPTLADVTPSLVRTDGAVLRLADMKPERPDAFVFRRISDPFEGPALEVVARFRGEGAPGVAVISLALFDEDAALRLQIATEGIPLRAIRYVDPESGAVVLGEKVQYVTDRSHLYTGQVYRDGRPRRAPLEATKPALLWSDADERGILVSLLDYVPSPAWLSMEGQPGLRGMGVGIELAASLGDFGPEATRPPALSIQLTEGPLGASTFARFRRIASARYPAPPWPSSARYQWGSWYAYGPGVNAAALYRQIELLAASFTDLGPWQFLIDAGWHIQYAREDAEPGAVDFDKFPAGVRAVADAAHARGMQVLLYLGTGFIHDSPGDGGEWLALRGLIERHPSWLIPFQHEAAPVRRFLLDYANPEVRAYVAGIIRDFFAVHGVDGILVDGLADAEGQLIPRLERDGSAGPPHPLLPTLDLYRLVYEEARRHRPDAFITNGWLNPTAANPYAQIFYYGDESDLIDAPYPFGGFLQKLDYALFSRLALGQRAYLGASRGDPLRPEARWWVQAGAALDLPASLGFDLERLVPEAIAAFRADLRALDPFQGTTTYGPGLFPDTFATARNGVTYLGVVNREPTGRAVRVALDPLGLAAEAPYTALDAATGAGRRVEGDFLVELPPRSFRLFVLRRDPGVLWTDSATGQDSVPSSPASSPLALRARGPAAVPGFMYLATPEPVEVLLDGVRLAPGGSGADRYAYDAQSGLLELRYAHGGERRIEVRW